jgi:hypothetical protein
MNEQPKKGQEHAAPDPSLNYERPSTHTKDNGSRLPSHTPGSNGNYPVLNILKRTCSVFDGARARTPIATLTVNEIHDAILGLDKRFNVKAKHAEMDELIPGGEAWTRCKESLPAIHSGGVIKTRERGKDREFKGSGFIILDVDGKDNPGKTYEDVYRAFKKCPYIVSLWTSCSGNGWKGVAALTETDDILALEQMRDTLKYLLGEEGITICGATSPSSLEFMSYDPNLVVFDERLIEDVVVDEIALMLSKESETAKLARLERAVGNLSETAFLKKLNECKECLVRAERAGVSIEIHHPEMTHFVWSINDGIARQTGERNAELTEELFEDLFGKWYVGAGVGRGQLHDAASRDHGEGWTWDGIGLAVNNVLDREELTSMKFGLGAVKPEAFQVVGSPEFLEAEAEREAIVAERKEVEEAEKLSERKAKIRALLDEEEDDGSVGEPLPGSYGEDEIVEDLLSLNEVSVWYAPPSSGKSFLMLKLACNLSNGTKIGGKRTDCLGGIVYSYAEGANGVKFRLAAALEHYGANPDKLRRRDLKDWNFAGMVAAHLEGKGNEPFDDYVYYLKCFAEKYHEGKLSLIIIDTISAAFAGMDESNESFAAVVTLCRKLSQALRKHGAPHVALVHHPGKDLERGSRGGSALKGNIDSEFTIDVVHNEEDSEEPGGRKKILSVTPTKSKEDRQDYVWMYLQLKLHVFDRLKHVKWGDKLKTTIWLEELDLEETREFLEDQTEGAQKAKRKDAVLEECEQIIMGCFGDGEWISKAAILDRFGAATKDRDDLRLKKGTGAVIGRDKVRELVEGLVNVGQLDKKGSHSQTKYGIGSGLNNE